MHKVLLLRLQPDQWFNSEVKVLTRDLHREPSCLIYEGYPSGSTLRYESSHGTSTVNQGDQKASDRRSSGTVRDRAGTPITIVEYLAHPSFPMNARSDRRHLVTVSRKARQRARSLDSGWIGTNAVTATTSR